MDKGISAEIIESYTVAPRQERIRLSDFAPGIFASLNSIKSTKKAIKKGRVLINGKRGYSGDYIWGGESICLLREEEPKQRATLEINLEVQYEDDYLAVVNKPAGILVSGNKRFTLQNALGKVLKPSSRRDALARPEPIHRLDYPTSGALLVGKTVLATQLANKMFKDRTIIKSYLAVTIGKQNRFGVVQDKVEGKAAKSEYKVLQSHPSKRFGFLNLVQLTLHTGRRHQLRIHMAGIGNPVLGDAEYGTEGLILKGKGLYLHSHSLQFTHPITHKAIKVVLAPPKKFFKLFAERLAEL
ncbi:23S rRNA pseudouridine1911/1915/1917 synthase [Saccharicrinis carchari]|uniref:23S rRNA pseudouridine1911/1915/1917 synthase n=1 Tax=Saccharicrinis carchari TaxID=1168039 RepID=A0A521DDM9_SACCC|nr:RluA family pseudouridine synthase [Saccharicrinis carchari]SMO69698.1 23S rRNA pseudouridine1911/1915/1917 synthase [Saccharicrinis carchari]